MHTSDRLLTVWALTGQSAASTMSRTQSWCSSHDWLHSRPHLASITMHIDVSLDNLDEDGLPCQPSVMCLQHEAALKVQPPPLPVSPPWQPSDLLKVYPYCKSRTIGSPQRRGSAGCRGHAACGCCSLQLQQSETVSAVRAQPTILKPKGRVKAVVSCVQELAHVPDLQEWWSMPCWTIEAGSQVHAAYPTHAGQQVLNITHGSCSSRHVARNQTPVCGPHTWWHVCSEAQSCWISELPM